MTEEHTDHDAIKFDFQQMLKDLEAEGLRPAPKAVSQSDISELFKSRTPR